MNIAFALYKFFPWGGLQKDTLRFAHEAASRGHNVTVFAAEWDGEKPEDIDVVLHPVHAWSNYGAMDKFAAAFSQYAKQGRADVTMAMNRIPGADYYFVADSCMKMYMPQKHSKLLLAIHPRYRTYLRHEAEICSENSRTVLMYIAQSQRREFMECYGLPQERLFYLPPGMDARCVRPSNAGELREAKRWALGLSASDLALILVGSNLRRKGVDRVMAALALLPREIRRRVKFLLAGADRREEVAAMADRFGVTENVMFLGGRNDVPELLLASDLMVHPAREEGTGTVLVEAIAAGLPVICTENCGFSPFVRDAAGLVLPPDADAKCLADMIAGSLRNLHDLDHRTLAYAATQDFTRRSKVLVDEFERFFKNKRN